MASLKHEIELLLTEEEGKHQRPATNQVVHTIENNSYQIKASRKIDFDNPQFDDDKMFYPCKTTFIIYDKIAKQKVTHITPTIREQVTLCLNNIFNKKG